MQVVATIFFGKKSRPKKCIPLPAARPANLALGSLVVRTTEDPMVLSDYLEEK